MPLTDAAGVEAQLRPADRRHEYRRLCPRKSVRAAFIEVRSLGDLLPANRDFSPLELNFDIPHA
jgi:hypothetical protein